MLSECPKDGQELFILRDQDHIQASLRFHMSY